jgi:hypothetical protein
LSKKDIEIFRSKGFQNVPKLGFWFENKPSGNPGLNSFFGLKKNTASPPF